MEMFPRTLKFPLVMFLLLAAAGCSLEVAAQVRNPWDYDVTLTPYPQAKWKSLTSYIDKPALGDVTNDGIPEIFAASVFGDVYCVDGFTGQLLWAYEDEHAFDIAIYICPALVDVDCDRILDVISVTPRGTVLCLDGRSGRRKWGFEAGAPIIHSPSAFDLDRNGAPEIAVADIKGTLFLLDSKGSLSWKAPGDILFSGTPGMGRIGDQAMVLVSDRSGVVRAYDGSSGRMLWRQPGNSQSLSTSPVAFKDNADPGSAWKVLVGTDRGDVHLINAQNGNLLWTRPITPREVVGDFALGDLDGDGAPEFVYSTSGSRIVAAGIRDGKELWSRRFKVPVREFMQTGSGKKLARDVLTGQPVIADFDGDGRLDVVADVRGLNNYVFGLRGSDGSEQWSYGTRNLLLNPALNESMTIACCLDVAPPGAYATTVPAYSQPTPVLADFDGDGRADLIVNDRDEVGLISVPLPAPASGSGWPKYMSGACNNNVNFDLPCLGTALPPTLALTIDPPEIFKGETARLCWRSMGADELLLEGGIGKVRAADCIDVRPELNTSWRAVARGCGGQVAAEVALLVKPRPVPPPVVRAPDDWALEDVFFEYDWYRLTPQAVQTLDANARKLQAHPDARVALEATCDERGARIYNQFLALARAEAVREYLVAKGINPSRLEVRALGESTRWDSRLSDEGWALNRRVHFVILR